ncbi:MAG: glycosyltransferase [Actinomycetota bacterium]
MSGNHGAVDLTQGAEAVDADGSGTAERRPARYERRRPHRPTLSVVIPTFEERENISVLLERLDVVLADFDHEIIVVDDDSPDGTWCVVEDIAAVNPRVHLLRRISRRGLSSAVIDGMTVAKGSVLAVMDADLQHDEEKLPELVSAILDDGADVCIGSRQADGGSYGDFGRRRRFVSWSGAQVAHHLLGVSISDPMTGYFAVSRQRFEEVRSTVNPRGFKIALELLARGSQPSVAEVGYHFRNRSWGATKLTTGVAFAYLWSVLGLALSRLASPTFPTYASIAVTGLCCRLSLLSFGVWLLPRVWLSMAAFTIAGLFEFGLHRRITFPEHRYGRPRSRVGQLLRFQLIGIHSTFALSGWMALLDRYPPSLETRTGVATAVAASTAGVLITVVLSFVANRAITWPPASTDGPTPANALTSVG